MPPRPFLGHILFIHALNMSKKPCFVKKKGKTPNEDSHCLQSNPNTKPKVLFVCLTRSPRMNQFFYPICWRTPFPPSCAENCIPLFCYNFSKREATGIINNTKRALSLYLESYNEINCTCF